MMDIRKKLDPEISKNLNKNYELFAKTYEGLFEDLKKRDVRSVCKNTGAKFLDGQNILIDFLGQVFLVSFTDKTIFCYKETKKEKGEPLDRFASAIILHYLNNSDGTDPEGRWISYRELPDGLFYSRTIPGVLAPIISKYPKGFDALLDATKKIGGNKSDTIKNGIVIYVFKKFPVLLVYEPEDEEFGADINILFDSSASHHLKTDIIKTVVVYIVKKILSQTS